MYKYHTQEINIRICVYLRQAFMRKCFVTKSCRFDVLNQCKKKESMCVRVRVCVCSVLIVGLCLGRDRPAIGRSPCDFGARHTTR